jgi:hypothetical protein
MSASGSSALELFNTLLQRSVMATAFLVVALYKIVLRWPPTFLKKGFRQTHIYYDRLQK